MAQPVTDQKRRQLDDARRNHRFARARERMQLIVNGEPRLSDAQFAELRALLPPEPGE